MPKNRSLCAAAISALFVIPAALPALWHDEELIPKTTINTGHIHVEDEFVVAPDWVSRYSVLMRGLQEQTYREFSTNTRGNNLNTMLIVDLAPAGTDAVNTRLQILDAEGAVLATVTGNGHEALRACHLMGPAPDTYTWQHWGVLVTTTTETDLTWQNDLDQNRPSINYGPVKATLTQTRTGPGFTGQTDPCKEAS